MRRNVRKKLPDKGRKDGSSQRIQRVARKRSSGSPRDDTKTKVSRVADFFYFFLRSNFINFLPAFIIIPSFGLITIFVLLSFVIPRLSIMFDDLNQALPLPTLLLVNISNVFGKIWWLMLGMLGLVIVLFKKWITSDPGRLCFDSFILRTPFLSGFIITVEVERFART